MDDKEHMILIGMGNITMCMKRVNTFDGIGKHTNPDKITCSVCKFLHKRYIGLKIKDGFIGLINPNK